MCTVAIVGLGTIGSAVASLVARMPQISAVTLVDHDAYDESNLTTQAIDASALGRPKVKVQASIIQTINPKLEVNTIEEHIENVPLGLMRGSILVSCVDNRRARQSVNRISWRCGSSWIDAAIGTASLVRISVYTPSCEAPCLECGWDERSYELLEQEYPCTVGGGSVPATGAPAELGALAASLQIAELRKLVSDEYDGGSLVGAQLMFDTTTHEKHLGLFQRNEKCRFDHEIWEIEPVDLDPRKHTLLDLFESTEASADPAVNLSIEEDSFATYLDCVACGRRSNIDLSLYGRLSVDARTCGCGGRMFATGFFSFESIRRDELSSSKLDTKLCSLGFRAGDVISVAHASGSVRHLEIGKRQIND